MKKEKTTLFILTCTPRNKRAKAKERKIFINGDYAAVMQMIEQISAEGSYAFSLAMKQGSKKA